MAREYDPRRPRVPVELAQAIDKTRGQVSFNRWVVAALERSVPRSNPAVKEFVESLVSKPAASGSEAVAQAREALDATPFSDAVERMESTPKFPHGRECPERGCDWSAPSPNATCPKHNRRIR